MKRSPQLSRLNDDWWHSLDEDPWFEIVGPFEAGKHLLTFAGYADDDTPASEMQLYYADANGQFSEASSIVLARMPRADECHHVRLAFELPELAPCLRFDPQRVAGKFYLAELQVRCEPSASLLGRDEHPPTQLPLESTTRPDLQTVARMSDELRQAGGIFLPSRMWDALNDHNLRQLQLHGLERFKRTVNQNYFNWILTGFDDNQYQNLLRYWLEHPSATPLSTELHGSQFLEGFFQHSPLADESYRGFYRFFVGLLWYYVAQHDEARLTTRLSEPALGDPIRVTLGGRLISQDLANSIHEYNTLHAALRPSASDVRPTIGELGAGYGRLADVWLSAESCRYMIFDVPPALYLSQWYLQQRHPQKRLFAFRSFRDFDQVRDELAEADVAFFTANQLTLFPDDYFDAFQSISALHEMRLEQIRFYVDQITRHARRAIYFKNWASWHNVADDIRPGRELYVPPAPWEAAFDRLHAIHDKFCEQLFVRP